MTFKVSNTIQNNFLIKIFSLIGLLSESGGDFVDSFPFGFGNSFVDKDPKQCQQNGEYNEYITIQIFLKFKSIFNYNNRI